MPALPLVDAARALGVAEDTLRSWLRRGCPAVQAGGRGRGHSARVDPLAVRAWRTSGGRHAAITDQAGQAHVQQQIAGALAAVLRDTGDLAIPIRGRAALLVQAYAVLVCAITHAPPAEPHPAAVLRLLALATGR